MLIPPTKKETESIETAKGTIRLRHRRGTKYLYRKKYYHFMNFPVNNILSSLPIDHFKCLRSFRWDMTNLLLSTACGLVFICFLHVPKDCMETNVPLYMTFVRSFLAIFLPYVCSSFTKLRF